LSLTQTCTFLFPTISNNQAFYQMGTGGSLPGSKADHTPLSIAEVKNGGAISSLPHASSWRGA
jgi:hypothetical protein